MFSTQPTSTMQSFQLPVPAKLLKINSQAQKIPDLASLQQQYCLCGSYTNIPKSFSSDPCKIPMLNSMPMNKYIPQMSSVSKPSLMLGMENDESDCEWLSSAPEYYNVKKANIAPMKNHKYLTVYKHNKGTGRVLRYFICKYDNCERKFNKTWNFIDHVRIHTGEKPYK
mmetsp:Transcript_16647/g.18503  ORF Transcript_16647/g.18503 Transcript_16647/m.18503 type:complete len:169 (-) Transcript_16647:95-601(-)